MKKLAIPLAALLAVAALAPPSRALAADRPAAADDHVHVLRDALGAASHHVVTFSLALSAMRSGLRIHSDHEPTNSRGFAPSAVRLRIVSAESTPPPQ